MPTNTIKRYFPYSSASLVHQNGEQLGPESVGLEVVLHTRKNEQNPCCAEIVSGDYYSDIGLAFEGKVLVDYDGVFLLPQEVGEMLTEAGFTVPPEYFA